MATNKPTMEFKRGDAVTHYFRIPEANWSAGGTLFFAAKVAPDNDTSDAAALIDKSFTDADTTITDGVVEYTLNFVAADTANITFDEDTDVMHLDGEFQFVPLTGAPTSFPGTNKYIDVIVYADIKRGTV